MAKVDRKRFECNALPKGWTREEVIRKAGLSAGTKDIFYYRYESTTLYSNLHLFNMFISSRSPNGKKFRSKPQLVRYLGDTVDLTTFDYKTGKINAILLRKNRKKAQPDLARGFRNDLSVIPPIRQTASIFKQPVTIVKSQECKVRHELKHGRQEKPRQVVYFMPSKQSTE